MPAEGAQHALHGPRITDVGAKVPVAAGQLALQPPALPGGGRLGAEEPLAHVVVDADDVHAQPGEMSGRLRTDQSGGAGNDCHAHAFSSPPGKYRFSASSSSATP